MNRWLLTVCIPQGPTPIVGSLIDLAERRPVAMGGEIMIVANFAYDTEQVAEDARARIEGANLGAICFINSFHAA